MSLSESTWTSRDGVSTPVSYTVSQHMKQSLNFHFTETASFLEWDSVTSSNSNYTSDCYLTVIDVSSICQCNVDW